MPPRENTTTRAYTLRLRGAEPYDTAWRDALWATHEAINNGAKVFGNWLLTLRGGLDHQLADSVMVKGKDKGSAGEQRKKRRVLLALSWLSVESRNGAPSRFVIASGKEASKTRAAKVIEAFKDILEHRTLVRSDIDSWVADCATSLSAAIRDDAVWVNRSKAFDEAVVRVGPSLMRNHIWDMLGCFFGDPVAYLRPLNNLEEEPPAVTEMVKGAGTWLSSRFGTGKGADFNRLALVYDKIAEWATQNRAEMTGKEAIAKLAGALLEFAPATDDLQGVKALVRAPGHNSGTSYFLEEIAGRDLVTEDDLGELQKKAQKDARKCRKRKTRGQRPYADAVMKDVEVGCGFTYRVDGETGEDVSVDNYHQYSTNRKWGTSRHKEYAVMLDHAARRVSLAHTWIKRAEAERNEFEVDVSKIDNIPGAVKDWLDGFCWSRSVASGSLEPYRIRRRAIGGWERVVATWGSSSCATEQDRLDAVKALQASQEIEKFGDAQLYEALASDDACCVWHKNGDRANPPDHRPLIDYVDATEAEYKKKRFKVPAYRHPDALLHPVFCDYGKSRPDIEFAIHKDNTTSTPRMLSMSLWTGSAIKKKYWLRWQSKRMAKDLALSQRVQDNGAPQVTRADRLGRAAASLGADDVVRVKGIFDDKDWNGRLQAPRQQLEAIAAVRDDPGLSELERDSRISVMKDHIRWFLTFSPKLRPQGPWYTKRPHQPKKPQALYRIPGLRVLSVDLGHRKAAACTVWETTSSEQVEKACKEVGHRVPDERDLYVHLKAKVVKPDDGQIEMEKTSIYRRIGPDNIDSGPHPSPWARLDRQFIVKLQGEDETSREASNQEIWASHQLDMHMGRKMPLIDQLVKRGWGKTETQKARLDALRGMGWKPVRQTEAPSASSQIEFAKRLLSVDQLMSYVVRNMRVALKRHGDRARIAFALTSDYKPMPGDRKYYFSVAEDASAVDDNNTRQRMQVKHIQATLFLWHTLIVSDEWNDLEGRQLWNQHVSQVTGYRVAKEVELFAAAEALLKDEKLRKSLSRSWAKRWAEEDERWRKRLRMVKDWLLPRGSAAQNPAIRRVGGLSLTRLANLTEFRRKIQVSFSTRIRPDGTRAEAEERFGQKTLDALERMRDQRVKQLASRIAEAALGIGRVKRIKRIKRHKHPQRPRVQVDEPCHVVVIENLKYYRPDEMRTRRENRQLMNWSSAKIKKYLEEACYLNGLLFREVPANYTSRQDSRTGAPGLRCQDVPVRVFKRSRFWRKEVERAKRRPVGARDHFLLELDAKCQARTATDWQEGGIVRVPIRGGTMFVSADPRSPAAKGLHADLNAAANIGLRLLTDPDWPGSWWYVPCYSATLKPVQKKKGKESAAIDSGAPLRKAPPRSRLIKTKSQSRDIINLWRDTSSAPLSAEHGPWKTHGEYRAGVEERVVNNLRSNSAMEL